VQARPRLGRPPASGSLDQMRRIQISANGAGECEVKFRTERSRDSVTSQATTAIAVVAEIAANVWWSEFDFDNGWTGGPVRSWDVAQQVLLWQHPISHAFSLGVFVTKHGVAGNRTVAVRSASPIPTETVILLSMTLLCSTISASRQFQRNSAP